MNVGINSFACSLSHVEKERSKILLEKTIIKFYTMRRGGTSVRHGTIPSTSSRPTTARITRVTQNQGQKSSGVGNTRTTKAAISPVRSSFNQPHLTFSNTKSSTITPQYSANQVKKVGNDSQTKMKTAPSAQKKYVPPDEIVKNAINGILSHKSTDISFALTYKAIKDLAATQPDADIFDYIQVQYIHRLEDNNIFGQDLVLMIDEWKKFMVEVNQIQSFMKFFGHAAIQNKVELLPRWKYVDMIKNQTNQCLSLAISTWNDEVHPKVLRYCGSEIQKCINQVISNGDKVDQTTHDLLDIFRVLGHNCIHTIAEQFALEYKSQSASMKEDQKMIYLITETKKLEKLFSLDQLQPLTIIPYMNELVRSLVSLKEEESLLKLKEYLLPIYAPEYSSCVIAEMNNQAIPVDYFSLANLVKYYSKILYNDAPVKRLVSNYISKGDSQFSQQFVSVLFSHFDLPENVKELAPLVPLYANSEELSTELVRGFILRILQKHSTSFEKESNFAKVLSSLFSYDQLSKVTSFLHHFQMAGSIMVFNSSLSMSLLQNDKATFPTDIETKVMTELKQYVNLDSNKKYHLSASFSSASVIGKWGKVERYITMSVLQYELIQMIIARDFNFMKTQASQDVITYALRFLVKANIVKKVGPKYYIMDKPPKDKKINVFNGAINVRKIERTKSEDEYNHTMSIQASIAKIMKSSRRLEESVLRNSVYEEFSQRFLIADGDFNRIMENMITSDFIERDKNDTRFLVYVP